MKNKHQDKQKKHSRIVYIFGLICLLFTVGILCMSKPAVIRAYAVEDIDNTEHHLTGDTEDSTNINNPGTSESPEDLADINIANTVTITYDNGNGQDPVCRGYAV